MNGVSAGAAFSSDLTKTVVVVIMIFNNINVYVYILYMYKQTSRAGAGYALLGGKMWVRMGIQWINNMENHCSQRLDAAVRNNYFQYTADCVVVTFH